MSEVSTQGCVGGKTGITFTSCQPAAVGFACPFQQQEGRTLRGYTCSAAEFFQEASGIGPPHHRCPTPSRSGASKRKILKPLCTLQALGFHLEKGVLCSFCSFNPKISWKYSSKSLTRCLWAPGGCLTGKSAKVRGAGVASMLKGTFRCVGGLSSWYLWPSEVWWDLPRVALLAIVVCLPVLVRNKVVGSWGKQN